MDAPSMQKREEDKRQVEELIVSNIKSLVYPYVEKMKTDSPDEKQQLLLGIIETHLNELLSVSVAEKGIAGLGLPGRHVH